MAGAGLMFEHQGDLAGLQPGDRFVLADVATGDVWYAGLMLGEGRAVMDMTSGLYHRPPIAVTAEELYRMYDPEIYEVVTVGGAV